MVPDPICKMFGFLLLNEREAVISDSGPVLGEGKILSFDQVCPLDYLTRCHGNR